MKILKYLLIGILAWMAISLAFGLVGGLIALVFKVAVPLALICGIGYVIYKLAGGDKAIGSSQKRLP